MLGSSRSLSRSDSRTIGAIKAPRSGKLRRRWWCGRRTCWTISHGRKSRTRRTRPSSATFASTRLSHRRYLGRRAENSFSFRGVALNAHRQAELVIFGLEGRPAARRQLFATARRRRGYAAGDVCDDLLVTPRVCFDGSYKYLGTAICSTSNPRARFPAFRWCGRAKGRFPWESGYDLSLKQYQPVLRSFS